MWPHAAFGAQALHQQFRVRQDHREARTWDQFLSLCGDAFPCTSRWLTLQPVRFFSYLIEASPQYAESLRAAYGQRPDFAVHQVGIAASDSTSDGVLQNVGGTGGARGQFQLRSVDSMFLGNIKHPTIDYLQIDVEECGPEALLGAEGMLRAHRIRVIHFECHKLWQDSPSGWTLKHAVDFLSAFEYDSFLLEHSGAVMLAGPFWDGRYEPASEFATGGHCNCLAVDSTWLGSRDFMSTIAKAYSTSFPWLVETWMRSRLLSLLKVTGASSR